MSNLMLYPFGSLLNEFLSSDPTWISRPQHPITVTSTEDGENIYIRAVAPGFEEKELNISTRGNRITISGKHEKSAEDKNWFVSDQTSFERSYALPQDVLVDSARAEYRSGILLVTLPKRKPSMPEIKSVPIKALPK